MEHSQTGSKPICYFDEPFDAGDQLSGGYGVNIEQRTKSVVWTLARCHDAVLHVSLEGLKLHIYLLPSHSTHLAAFLCVHSSR